MKVKSKTGGTIYEQKLKSMIVSWHLAADALVFQQDFRLNTITFVRLSTSVPPEVKQFRLPEEVEIRNPIRAAQTQGILDKACQRSVIGDKQALRQKVEELLGAPKPEKWLLQMVDDKLFILGAFEVVFFRPDRVIADDRGKEIWDINRGQLETLSGYPHDHRIIAIAAKQQNIDRFELNTFSEKPSENKLGVQCFWEEDGAVRCKHNSAAAWQFSIDSRIVKIELLRRRHVNEDSERSFAARRDCWRDQGYVMLDEEGNLFISEN